MTSAPTDRDFILSDIHVGPGLGPWEWLTSEGFDRLQRMLPAVAAGFDRMILVGDVWDNWTVPHDIAPLTMREIVSTGPAKALGELLAQVARTTRVIYVPGNHDMHVDEGMLPAGVTWGGEIFCDAGCHYEHGHLHALFCAPDPSMQDNLPLGYFISRLAATADRNTGSHGPTRQQIVRELLDAATNRESLAEAVLDVVAARAGVGRDEPIQMPADLWQGKATTVRQVRVLYRDLWSRFVARRGALAAAISIPAELGSLDLAADELLLTGAQWVVMGHTHRAVCSNLPHRAYANSGCCCHTAPADWVQAIGSDLQLHTYC